MPHSGIPEDVKDEVVRLYLANTKNSEITSKTGVERSAIYWILDQRGIEPNRQRQRFALDPSELLAQLTEAHKTIGRLEAERQRLLGEVERLKTLGTPEGHFLDGT